MAKSLGGALAAGILGGVAEGAKTKLDILKEEAAEARQKSLMKFQQGLQLEVIGKQHEGAKELQESSQDFTAAQDKLKMDQQSEQFKATQALTREQGAAQRAHASALTGMQMKHAETLALQGQTHMERMFERQQRAMKDNVVIGYIGDTPVYANEPEKTKLESFVGVTDKSINTQVQQLKAAAKADTEIHDEKLEAAKKTKAFQSLPKETQAYAEAQFKLTGTADLADWYKISSAEKIALKSAGVKDFKSPTAEHIKVALGQMQQDETFSGLAPEVQFVIATKMATAAANGLEMTSFKGKELTPEEVAEAADSVLSKEMDAVHLKDLSPKSINDVIQQMLAKSPTGVVASKSTSVSATRGRNRGSDTNSSGMLSQLWDKFEADRERNKAYISGQTE